MCNPHSGSLSSLPDSIFWFGFPLPKWWIHTMFFISPSINHRCRLWNTRTHFVAGGNGTKWRWREVRLLPHLENLLSSTVCSWCHGNGIKNVEEASSAPLDFFHKYWADIRQVNLKHLDTGCQAQAFFCVYLGFFIYLWHENIPRLIRSPCLWFKYLCYCTAWYSYRAAID